MKRSAMSVALVTALSMVGSTAVFAQDDEAGSAEDGTCLSCLYDLDARDFGVVPMGELVAGEPISHWARKRDEWWMSMPFAEHYGPQNDCQASQGGPVFNLNNGMFGATAHYECEIQPDQYVLITPGGWGNASPDRPAEELTAQTLNQAMFMTNPRINVDGRDIPVGGSSWIMDDPFTIDLPEDNLEGLPAGEATMQTMGWFVMLEPLAPGKHNIVISDDLLVPAIAPEDIDPETGVLNEEFVPVGTPIQATAFFDITVPGGDDEAAAE
jgi:hypothetical protein